MPAVNRDHRVAALLERTSSRLFATKPYLAGQTKKFGEAQFQRLWAIIQNRAAFVETAIATFTCHIIPARLCGNLVPPGNTTILHVRAPVR
jgi:hypothetical protein